MDVKTCVAKAHHPLNDGCTNFTPVSEHFQHFMAEKLCKLLMLMEFIWFRKSPGHLEDYPGSWNVTVSYISISYPRRGLIFIRHIAHALKITPGIKNALTDDSVQVGVEIRMVSERVNTADHTGNNRSIIEDSLVGLFNSLPGATNQGAIERLVKPKVDTQHLQKDKGGTQYRNPTSHFLYKPLAELQGAPRRARGA